jgi:subtilisin
LASPSGPRPAYTRESSVLRLPSAVSLEDLSPEWAWGGATGDGVRVAVIDSGIEATHPALEDCVDVEGGVEVRIGADEQAEIIASPHDDSYGHGTACAGIIHSLAPQARITSVKVLGPTLGGKAAAFLKGLGWAIEQGFDVINLSLGTHRRDWALPFYEVCDQAYFKNCFLVTAANNVARPSFPSMFGSVASVACNLATDPFRFHFNPDPPTEFLARGIDVDLAWQGGGRTRATGNSFAAPHITGIVALIRSKHPELRPFQVKTVLWATAANVWEMRGAPVLPGRLSRAMHSQTITARATSAVRLR